MKYDSGEITIHIEYDILIIKTGCGYPSLTCSLRQYLNAANTSNLASMAFKVEASCDGLGLFRAKELHSFKWILSTQSQKKC